MTDNTLQQTIKTLKSYQNYRLIERYEQPLYYCLDDGSQKFRGVFLDVEATGLYMATDQIIELGWVVFEYGADGRIFKILDVGSEYQDPGKDIPAEIVALTGINDAMVKGCRINKQKLFQRLSEADIVIAHHAGFDRPFIETLWEDSPQTPWACSMTQIPWKQEAIESPKLEYLAYRFGFFYEGHRASTDCLAGVHLLSKTLPLSKEQVLKVLLQNSAKKTFRVWAVNAPIEQKDILKARQYRWSPAGEGKHKAWFIELEADRLLSEITFLQTLYAYPICLPVEELNAKNRFSRKTTTAEHWIGKPSDIELILSK